MISQISDNVLEKAEISQNLVHPEEAKTGGFRPRLNGGRGLEYEGLVF